MIWGADSQEILGNLLVIRDERIRALEQALQECAELSNTFCCSSSCEADARTLRSVIDGILGG